MKIGVIKALVLLKLSLFGVFLLFYNNVVTFGEKTAAAENQQESNAVAEKVEKPAVVARKSKKIESSDSQNDVSQNRSFLDKLLTLPDLNVEESSKEDIGRYLTIIEQAKQQVENKLTILDHRLKAYREIEENLDKKISVLDEERQFFASTIQSEKKIKEERLEILINLYAKMEPKKAAPIFEEMDRDLAVALFKKLKEKQVTKILEIMDPQKSVKLTEYFGRIGSGREYELLKEMNKSLTEMFDECKQVPAQ